MIGRRFAPPPSPPPPDISALLEQLGIHGLGSIPGARPQAAPANVIELVPTTNARGERVYAMPGEGGR